MSFEPTNRPLSLEDARSALAANNSSQAIRIAKEILGRDGENPEAWQLLAEAYLREDRVGEAAHCFGRCAKLQPDAPQPHLDYAQALLAMGDKKKAREELKVCLALDEHCQRAKELFNQLGTEDGAAVASSEYPGVPTPTTAAFGTPAVSGFPTAAKADPAAPAAGLPDKPPSDFTGRPGPYTREKERAAANARPQILLALWILTGISAAYTVYTLDTNVMAYVTTFIFIVTMCYSIMGRTLR